MATLANGSDSEGGERFGACEYNDIKNHWRTPDPCANLSDLQPGMIVSDENDDRLYVVSLISGCDCSEIVQSCVPLSSDSYIGFGDNRESDLGYDSLHCALMMGVPVATIASGSCERGLIIMDEADLAAGADVRAVVPPVSEPSVFIVDSDLDSYLGMGHAVDDRPGIWSGPDDSKPLAIQYEATADVTFFEASGPGENRLVYIYGYVTAGTAPRYGSFQVEDTNDEFVIAAENNANIEGVTVSLPETNQRFRVRQNADIISWYHDGTNAFMGWSAGFLRLMTDEGVNTNTLVQIYGKGAGEGYLQLYDEDNAEYIQINALGGAGYIFVGGTVPGPLELNHLAESNIYMFSSAASGETRELNIYGFRAADALRSLEIGVGIDAANIASFDGLSGYYFDGNIGIGTTVFGTNADYILGLANANPPTTSPADISQMWSADVLGVANKAGPHWRSEEDGMYAWHGGAGTINCFTYQDDIADDGTFNLPAITDACWGFIQAGNNEEYALFTVDDDGDVTLISNSANVVANADTDGKICLGTAGTQEPLVIRNRLGAQKNINLIIWYS